MSENLISDIHKALDAYSIVSVTDPKGKIIFVNERFCEISKYTAAELIGQDHRILNSKEHSKEFWVDVWKTISAGKSWHGEVCNKAKDGSFYWVDSSIVPVLDAESKIKSFVSIRRVITRQKQLENLAKEQELKILASARMSAVGEMAGMIAHEINNPLTVIMGKTRKVRSLLKESAHCLTTVEPELSRIDEMSNRIIKIVSAVKKSSRDSSQDPFELCNLDSIIQDVLDMSHEKLARKGVQLKKTNPPNISFECRPSQITQILLNLINNSCDAVENLPEKWIELNIESAPDLVIFAVKDSGKGISDEVSAKLMQPFFTTKPAGKGTGIGLGISRNIALSHKGKLYLDKNCPNTKFVLELPLKQYSQVLKAA